MGATDHDPLVRRLQGRVDWLLRFGRVKDPELMQSAVEALTEIIDATRCLLEDLGEPEDGMQAHLMGRCRAAIAKAAGGEA